MGNQDAVRRGPGTIVDDKRPVFVAHFERVDHHEGANIDFYPTTPQLEHFTEVRILKKQFASEIIVLLVESAAGNKNLNHGRKGKDLARKGIYSVARI